MNFTSINHCARSNFQIDYGYTKEKAIIQFKKWCEENDVIWAKLFDAEDGRMVAYYNNREGLVEK